jgi:stage II sporulation protein D
VPNWQGETPGQIEVSVGQAPSAKAPPAEAGLDALNGLPLRVLLRKGRQGLKVSCTGGLRLLQVDGDRLAALPPEGRARLGAAGGQLTFDGKDLGVGEARIAPLEADQDVRVAGHRYRGRLWLRAVDGQLAVVNQVGLEDYLKGVLPGEVPSDWPLQALKAQAIAARSFAVSRALRSRDAPWDLDDSTASQVYRGADGERDKPSQAVDDSRGLVLGWHGQVIEAFFHSNSGGHTAAAGEVWGGASPPYLQGEMDSASEDQPHYAWAATVPREQAQRALERAGLWKGYLDDMVGRERSDSGRWTQLDLLGGGARRRVSGNALRMALGADRLKSTLFRVRVRGDDFVFDGLGWGHGVGLSQEGAFVMAKDGHDCRSILEHYYPGTRLAALKW